LRKEISKRLKLATAIRVQAARLVTTTSGDVGQAYRRSLNLGKKYRCVNVGDLITRPKGLDQLRLKWWSGVGAVIVVNRGGEDPSQGEGRQLDKKNST